MLLDASFVADPYPAYKQLLASGPIHRFEMLGGAWAFPRHSDVTALLKDPRLSARRSAALINQFPAEARAEFAEFERLFSMWMLFYDPPEHTRPRRSISRGFGLEFLNRVRAKVQAVVDELLDAVEYKGCMEAISEFASPLPAIVIGELMGVPREERSRFVTWSAEIAEFFGSSSPTLEMARRAQRSLIELNRYLASIANARRGHPGDDLISILLSDQQCTLREEELHAQCAMLLFAGHETTRNLIGNGLLALLQNPDQERLLRYNPCLARTAVDEFLRYDSPVQIGTRLAKQDLELYGNTIRSGDLIIFLLGAANRDPQEFLNPDELDITRDPNRHVSFGYGPHMCLGAPLARLEGEIAFHTLLRRFAAIQLTSVGLEWSSNFGFRGLRSLPLSFELKASRRCPSAA